MAYQRTMFTYPSNCTETWITYEHTICRTRKDTSFPAQFRCPKAMPFLEMFSQLKHNWSIKLTQPSIPARPMSPYTLSDLTEPGTCIIANAGITPESEALLRNSNVPEDDGNRKMHNKVGEAIMGPSSVNMNPSPSQQIPLQISLLWWYDKLQ